MSRPPVTAATPGDATNLLADAGTSAAAAKRNEVSKDSAANDNSHVANAKDSSKLDPHGDATASSGVGSPSDKSSTAAAPTATAVNDASSPPPNVAEAPASGQEHLPAPGNVNSPGELVELPKSEPPATAAPEHDHAAATLLTQTPPEPAPLPSASPIKDNLGSADPVGMAPAPAPATTANLSPAPNRSGEPPSLPAPTGDPMQLAAALEPVGDEKPSNPASARDPIGPEPTNREPSLPGFQVTLIRRSTMTRARPSPFLVQNHKSKANLCQPKTLTIRRSSPTRQTMNPQTRTGAADQPRGRHSGRSNRWHCPYARRHPNSPIT